MSKWKALAILFTLFTIGALKETIRIFTSNAPDIAENRKSLMLMSLIITVAIIFFTIKFWKKASAKNLF
jgi:hypothetical protein